LLRYALRQPKRWTHYSGNFVHRAYLHIKCCERSNEIAFNPPST